MGDQDDCLSPATQCPDDSISKERLSNVSVDYMGISASIHRHSKQISRLPAESGSSKMTISASK